MKMTLEDSTAPGMPNATCAPAVSRGNEKTTRARSAKVESGLRSMRQIEQSAHDIFGKSIPAFRIMRMRAQQVRRNDPALPVRTVLTVYFGFSPETGFLCLRHRRDAKHRRRLDSSVERSRPRGFAV
jgi:hypothetical protein